MKISRLEAGKKPNSVEIKALMGASEFRQLLGYLDNLCVFETKTIVEHSSVIKTGARHNCAKYLLFPVKLRRKFKTDEFDFEKISCGKVEYKDSLFVIYKVPRKLSFESIKKEGGEEG